MEANCKPFERTLSEAFEECSRNLGAVDDPKGIAALMEFKIGGPITREDGMLPRHLWPTFRHLWAKEVREGELIRWRKHLTEGV
jgi:hypothetical protein